MAGSRFLEEIGRRVVLGDGATGTELLRRGCLPGPSLVELNLTRPGIVLDLHRDYVAAGAELISTNTFLANRLRLKAAGLADRAREINLAGARLACEAARGALVAGSVGPLSGFRWKDRKDAYLEQCTALAEGGCELLRFETFTELDDLLLAASVGEETGLPVVGQMASKEIFRYTAALHKTFALDLVGVNCVSPEQAKKGLEFLKQATPGLSAFPSAGLPGKELSAGEFAEGVLKLVEAGARLVGGCCGAGPQHIREAASILGRGT